MNNKPGNENALHLSSTFFFMMWCTLALYLLTRDTFKQKEHVWDYAPFKKNNSKSNLADAQNQKPSSVPRNYHSCPLGVKQPQNPQSEEEGVDKWVNKTLDFDAGDCSVPGFHEQIRKHLSVFFWRAVTNDEFFWFIWRCHDRVSHIGENTKEWCVTGVCEWECMQIGCVPPATATCRFLH